MRYPLNIFLDTGGTCRIKYLVLNTLGIHLIPNTPSVEESWHTSVTLQGNDFAGIDPKVDCPLAHTHVLPLITLAQSNNMITIFLTNAATRHAADAWMLAMWIQKCL